MQVSVIHIIAGLLILVALYKKNWESVRARIEPYHQWAFAIAVGVAAYHISKFLKTKRWIYLFHAIFVAGTFGVIGWNLKIGRQVLQLLATAMIAYHAAILADVV
jgi:hypothetical protein